MKGAETQLCRLAAGPKADAWQVVAHLGRAIPAIGGITKAELPLVVAAPALDTPIIQERARVQPESQLCHIAAAPKADEWQVVAHLRRAVAAVGPIAKAERPEVAVAPSPTCKARNANRRICDKPKKISVEVVGM